MSLKQVFINYNFVYRGDTAGPSDRWRQFTSGPAWRDSPCPRQPRHPLATGRSPSWSACRRKDLQQNEHFTRSEESRKFRLTLFSIEVCITEERSPGAREWHHGKRNWDGNIHTDLPTHSSMQGPPPPRLTHLAHINLLLELPSGGPVVSEYCCPVAVGIPKTNKHNLT